MFAVSRGSECRASFWATASATPLRARLVMSVTRRAWMSTTFPPTTGGMPAAYRSARSIALRLRPFTGKSVRPAGLPASHARILRVARTIADLAGADRIDSGHVSEAIGYRTLDRKLWLR